MPPSPAPPASATVRADIQGLRAVAVVAVVLDHLAGGPPGGFAGVDVFFVISGFLITGLLLRERDRRGAVSLRGFYLRRARRILPAALLVLAVTAVGAAVAFPRPRFAAVGGDVLAALGFAMNWREVVLGTDYFAAGGPASPLQHFWSLAVEEQFYLAWPWLLAGAAVVARRRSSRAAAAAVGVVTIASFAVALQESAAAPAVAYFSTWSRGWELGLGGLVVLAERAGLRIPERLRGPLAWTGLAAIGVAVAGGAAGLPFPAPGALPAVLGAALVLAAGESAPGTVVLTNPVARWLGDRSYSLYLWHLPVIALLPVLLPVSGPAEAPAAAVLMVLLAAASFRFVEEPFRRGRAGTAPAGGAGRPLARPAVLAGGAGLVAALVAAALVLPAPAAPRRSAAPAPPSQPAAPAVPAPQPAATATTAPRPSAPADPAAALTGRLRAALRARSWPRLSPGLDALDASARVPEWSRDDCLVVTSGKLARCTWGRATAARTVAVVGDSMAVNWLPAVRRALTPLGYRVVALTMAQCPAGEVAVKDTGGSTGFAPQCAAHLAWDVAQLRRLRPRLVLATSAMETRYRLVSGASGSAALAEWRRGAARFLDRVRPLTSRLVVADPAPVRVPLADCATRFSRPADCVSPLGADDRTFDAATARAASAAGAAHVATASWFCVHGRCPAFADGAPLYVDREHLTGAYAVRLAPVLRQALERAGALPR